MGAVSNAFKAVDPTTETGLANIAIGVEGGMVLGALGHEELAKDTFFGGAEEKAAAEKAAAAKRAQELAGGRFEQIVTPGLEIGQQAQQQQAALAGVLGPEAQAEAFKGFQESPGTAFLREQGLRELGTQSAVTGSGGGNRLRALSEFNQGLALQDLSRQQQQLGQISQQGISLAGTGATLTGLETGGISAEGAALAAAETAQSDATRGFIEQGVGVGSMFVTGGATAPAVAANQQQGA